MEGERQRRGNKTAMTEETWSVNAHPRSFSTANTFRPKVQGAVCRRRVSTVMSASEPPDLHTPAPSPTRNTHTHTHTRCQHGRFITGKQFNAARAMNTV